MCLYLVVFFYFNNTFQHRLFALFFLTIGSLDRTIHVILHKSIPHEEVVNDNEGYEGCGNKQNKEIAWCAICIAVKRSQLVE